MTTPTFSSDPVLDDVKGNLKVAQDFITTVLTDQLKELKELTNSETVDVATLKSKTVALMELVEAQNLARTSVEQLERGRSLEEQVLTVASDETVPLPEVKNRADKWAVDAAKHFDQARSNVTQAAKLVSKQPGFLSAVTKFFKKSEHDTSNPIKTFLDRISVATFGLAVLSTRVTKLPGALMEHLEQHIDRRVVAVGEVVGHWKQRAASDYQQMKQDLEDVVDLGLTKAQSTTASVAEGARDVWDRSVAAGNAVEAVLQDTVLDPAIRGIENFVAGARAKIAGWSASAYEVLQQQKSSLKEHYNSNIQERRDRRTATPPPLPERIEPQLPKLP